MGEEGGSEDGEFERGFRSRFRFRFRFGGRGVGLGFPCASDADGVMGEEAGDEGVEGAV